MAAILQWGGFVFGISTSSALLFHDLKISVEGEYSERQNISQKYASPTNGKIMEFSMQVYLYRSLGIDVRVKTMELLNHAQRAGAAYFYNNGEKLLPMRFLMTKASTSEILMSLNGVWLRTTVDCTWKQCDNTWMNGYAGEQKVSTTTTAAATSSSSGSTSKTTAAAKSAGTSKNAAANSLQSQYNTMKANGASQKQLDSLLKSAISSGKVTTAQATSIRDNRSSSKKK